MWNPSPGGKRLTHLHEGGRWLGGRTEGGWELGLMVSASEASISSTRGAGGAWGYLGSACASVSLPAAASPTSEYGEEETETRVALLRKGINIQLFLGYKYHLTSLCRKARV